MGSNDNRFAEGFKKYAQNTGCLFLEKIIRIFVAMFVWALAARFLGAEKFGVFNFALSFVYLLGIISDLGLDQVVTRELVKKECKTNWVMGTALIMKFFGCISAIVLIIVVTGFLSMAPYTRLIICMLSLRLFFQSFNVADLYFQSQVLSRYVVYSQITALLVTTVLCLSFVYFKLPLIYFVNVVVIETAITAISNIFYITKYQKIFDWKFDPAIGGKLLRDAWPMLVSSIAIAIYMRIDQIMLKEMLGAVSVGHYAAATRLSEVSYSIPMVVTSSLFPAITNAKLRDRIQYENRLRALFAILFWSAFIISLVAVWIAIPLVRILYGQEFTPASTVLSIHIWASIFVFLGVARQSWAINENLQIYMMFYAIVGAVSNVLLNLVLIPLYDIRGAAIATVSSYFIAVVLANCLSPKTRNVFWMQIQSLNIIRAIKHVT